jgi:hypothetical protein
MRNGEIKKVKAKFNELKRSPQYRFPDRGGLKAPNQRGVYVIYGPRKETLHVGGTPRGRRGICQRLSNHLYGQSSFTIKSLFLKRHGGRTLRKRYHYVRAHCTYQCLRIRNDRLRALVEAYAIGCLCPDHIGMHQLS